jgi:hypothetical protein
VSQIISLLGCNSPEPKALKQPVSRKSSSSLSFCPTGMGRTFMETSGMGLEKIAEYLI